MTDAEKSIWTSAFGAAIVMHSNTEAVFSRGLPSRGSCSRYEWCAQVAHVAVTEYRNAVAACLEETA